jgi:hypothetical protein
LQHSHNGRVRINYSLNPSALPFQAVVNQSTPDGTRWRIPEWPHSPVEAIANKPSATASSTAKTVFLITKSCSKKVDDTLCANGTRYVLKLQPPTSTYPETALGGRIGEVTAR